MPAKVRAEDPADARQRAGAADRTAGRPAGHHVPEGPHERPVRQHLGHHRRRRTGQNTEPIRDRLQLPLHALLRANPREDLHRRDDADRFDLRYFHGYEIYMHVIYLRSFPMDVRMSIRMAY